jgi:hypothetical protein
MPFFELIVTRFENSDLSSSSGGHNLTKGLKIKIIYYVKVLFLN